MTETIVRGTSNVFADLGYADAEERQTKTRIALEINSLIRARTLKPTEAGATLGVSQPEISALLDYRLDGISV